jgi:hypothetical protein
MRHPVVTLPGAVLGTAATLLVINWLLANLRLAS